ncbi:MAG: serine/threonine-protein kinase [Myxococcota bacterium]
MPFGHWMLLKRLAVGGMAELFLAKDTRTDRLMVLKRILPYLAEEAEFVRMFLDEARIAASLHHANVVEVYELGRLDASTFIAMEWVDGVDLRRVLAKEQERGGVVPPGVAAWMVARLCEGLHYAHFRTGADGKPLGIIHRDVSPQNVMVSFTGDVKLVDFGIAKATAWMSRSKPGVIKGKFLYLAPEQLGQEKLDHRADLFALGTMLYELTTGKSPFYRSSTEAVIYAIKMEDAQAPHVVRPGYPLSLSKVVMKCLTRDRTRRYQSADEIRVALEDFLRVDAPTTRNDVVKYVAGLFGAEEERTSIYIPPNAQTTAPVGRDAERTDETRPSLPSSARPERDRATGFEQIDEERTAPIAQNPVKAKLPEGRRPTGETQSIPGEPEPTAVTAPMPSPVKALREAAAAKEQAEREAAMASRDSASTAVLDEPPAKKFAGYVAAGSGEVDETAVSTSGARDVRVGEVLPALLPARAQARPEDESSAALRPIDTPPRGARPGPPVPSSEIPEISDVSVVSAGESTLALDAAELPPMPTPEPPRRNVTGQENRRSPAELKRAALLQRPPETKGPDNRAPGSKLPETRVADAETAEPMPPAPKPPEPKRPIPQPDKPARRGTQQQVKKARPVGDADDLINTVDMANARAFDEDDPRRKYILLGIVGVSAFLVILLLVWVLWPAPKPKPAPNRPPVAVKIQLNAPKGTTLKIDTAEITPGDVRQVTPGKLSIDYRCPVKKNQKAKDERLTVDVVAGEGVQAIEIPCK